MLKRIRQSMDATSWSLSALSRPAGCYTGNDVLVRRRVTFNDNPVQHFYTPFDGPPPDYSDSDEAMDGGSLTGSEEGGGTNYSSESIEDEQNNNNNTLPVPGQGSSTENQQGNKGWVGKGMINRSADQRDLFRLYEPQICSHTSALSRSIEEFFSLDSSEIVLAFGRLESSALSSSAHSDLPGTGRLQKKPRTPAQKEGRSKTHEKRWRVLLARLGILTPNWFRLLVLAFPEETTREACERISVFLHTPQALVQKAAGVVGKCAGRGGRGRTGGGRKNGREHQRRGRNMRPK